jgi:N-acyl-L-homoserine lactone synthetase
VALEGPAVVTAYKGPAEPAATIERLAARALANLAPLVFEVAQTAADRDAVLRMRYDTVVEEGWMTPEDHPDGRERDEYDDEAIFIVCRDAGAIVGSMRLVPPSPSRPLPTEREFSIRARPPGQVPEVGRIIVTPAARPGRSHLVLGGLCARGWLESRALGYDRAISTAASEVIDLYRSVGMRITVLGPAQLHWGTQRAPIQITGDEASFAFLSG